MWEAETALWRGKEGEPWDGRDQTTVFQETATNDLIPVFLPTYTAYEEGTDRVFWNSGIQYSDTGESPKRKNTTVDIVQLCLGYNTAHH